MLKQFLILVFMTGMSFAQIVGLVSATGYGLAAPGGAASIYGTFTGVPVTVAPSTILPTTLGGVQVLVNGIAAPLYYVSPTQINIQMPWETNASLPVILSIGSATGTFQISPLAGSIFETSNITQQGAILDVNYKLIDYNNPAVPGNVVQIYCTGLGPVTTPQVDGVPASATTLAYVTNTPIVTIAGEPAQVLFAGLAPDFVGLYQINAVVPNNIALNDIPIVSEFHITFAEIATNGITYNAVQMGYVPYKP